MMTSFGKPIIAGFLTTAMIITASGAGALEAPTRENEVSGTIAGGVAAVPDYEGAKEQKCIPLIAGDIRWGARYLAIEGPSAWIDVLNSKVIESGPAANLTFPA